MIATDRFAQVDVLGVPVHAGTMDDAVDVVGSWIKDRDPGYAIFRDVHGIMQSQRRADVLEAHRNAGLVTCDGIPLVWAAKWAGVPEAERVCGPDFLTAFCSQAEAQGWKSFFYGGSEGTPQKVADRLRERFPDLQVVGTHSPPYRPLTPTENAGVIDMINRSEADIVWVGLSTPKQELWMQDHVGIVDAPALLGVGAAFDFLTGDVRRAPRWLQGTGFEWVYRVLREPRRLGARYLRNNPAFLRAILFNQPRLHDATANTATANTAKATEGTTSNG
jgi:N-acetylglucosaminyldiphosphoundecaprenol N-acetyl-beta-D-mannosaminyltransferase